MPPFLKKFTKTHMYHIGIKGLTASDLLLYVEYREPGSAMYFAESTVGVPVEVVFFRNQLTLHHDSERLLTYVSHGSSCQKKRDDILHSPHASIPRIFGDEIEGFTARSREATTNSSLLLQ